MLTRFGLKSDPGPLLHDVLAAVVTAAAPRLAAMPAILAAFHAVLAAVLAPFRTILAAILTVVILSAHCQADHAEDH
jgi:hypothetical protein